MRAFIEGTGCLSTQPLTDLAALEPQLGADALRAREPSYASLAPPNVLRRMARAVKMGLTVSREALAQAQQEGPDAILAATGLGCLEEAERFLLDVAATGEQFLGPTAFSQSTHNTIASQISLALRCQGYNATYVDRGASFEGALADALLLLEEGEAQSALVCAVDEFTAQYAAHHRSAGHLRAWSSREDVLEARADGAPMGEGAAAFVLSKERRRATVGLRDAKALYRPEQPEHECQRFLSAAGMGLGDVDLVLLGTAGDARHDGPLRRLQAELFAQSPLALFKPVCGEFDTASAFGFWLGCRLLESGGEAPEPLRANAVPPRPLRNVLMVNGSRGTELTFALLSKLP